MKFQKLLGPVVSAVLFLALQQSMFAQEQLSVVDRMTDQFEKAWQELVVRPDWLLEDNLDSCPLGLFPPAAENTNIDWKACDIDTAGCLKECKDAKGWACYGLALAVQKRKGPFHDVSELLFLRSCKLGVTSGCTNRAAALLELNSNDSNAMKCAADTFEMACDRNDAWGCAMFGFVVMEGIGRQKDPKRALMVLPRACKRVGDKGDACIRATELIELVKRTQKPKPRN